MQVAKAASLSDPHLTTHWSGRPTSHAFVALFQCLPVWAAAHRERWTDDEA